MLILDPIQDGTKVTVTAGNEENSSADVKNNVTEANAQMARFSDLRFVGKSGRGRDAKNSNRKESLPVKNYFDPDSGNEVGVLTRKSKNLYFRLVSIWG